MYNYNLLLSVQDLQIIDQLLQQAPYKVAAPLVEKINHQIRVQRESGKEGRAKEAVSSIGESSVCLYDTGNGLLPE